MPLEGFSFSVFSEKEVSFVAGNLFLELSSPKIIEEGEFFLLKFRVRVIINDRKIYSFNINVFLRIEKF